MPRCWYWQCKSLALCVVPNVPQHEWVRVLVEYIDRTDQGSTRPSLFYLWKRSEKVEGISPRLFHYAQKGKITIGRVPPRSVLYLLYIKHDQKILKFDMSIGTGEARALFHVW